MTVTVISSLEELTALRPAWDALYNERGALSPFSSFSWVRTWWTYRGQENRMLVLVCKDTSGAVIAIAPFYVSLKFGYRTVRFIGSGNSDYLDILMRSGTEQTAIKELCEQLKKLKYSWDMIDLMDMPEQSLFLQTLRKDPKLCALPHTVQKGLICPYVSWERSHQEYLAARSSNFRYDLKRKFKRAEKMGTVSFEVLKDMPEQGIEQFASLYEKRWSSKDTNATIRNETGQKLLNEAIRTWAQEGILRIPVMKMNGTIVAFCLGFIKDARFYYYIPSFDPAFVQASPGKLLVEYILKSFPDLGIHEIDFMKGEERYKLEWSDTFRQNYRLLLWNKRPASLLYAGTYLLFLYVRNKARTSEFLRFLRFNALGYIKNLIKKPHTAPTPVTEQGRPARRTVPEGGAGEGSKQDAPGRGAGGEGH